MKQAILLITVISFLTLSSCSLWNSSSVRSQSPEKKTGYSAPEKPRLVGDIVRPWGLDAVRVEGIAIATGLDDTGSDPPMTKFRQLLYRDLKKRGVQEPTVMMASKKTSMVLVRAMIPPGAQKGQRIDVEVQTPSRSETTSLRGGWLMETDLRKMAVFDDTLRTGDVMATAFGSIMTPPRTGDAKKDAQSQLGGLVLGGGTVQKSRNLGLILPNEDKVIMVKYADLIQKAINRRFNITGRGGARSGVAKAKDNRYIELYVHPRYKNNVYRYMSVVRAVALIDAPQVRLKRLEELRVRLKDPFTTSYAALELEALGPQGDVLEILREGMKSSDVQVQFYSAEALAFLDQSDCAPVLAKIAKEQDAMRGPALGALSALDDINSYEVLLDLMRSGSFETRYSAFRALWYMRPNDPIARGITLGKDGFTLHYIESDPPNLIHITKDTRPEITLFGRDIKLSTPLLLDVGKNIMLKSDGDDKIEVSKFSIDEPDQKRTISTDVAEVIKTVADLGATYPDVVEMIQTGVSTGCITAKVLVNAVPKGERYYRVKDTSKSSGGADDPIDGDSHSESEPPVSEEDMKIAGETPLSETPEVKIDKEDLEPETTDRNSKRHNKLSNPKPWYWPW